MTAICASSVTGLVLYFIRWRGDLAQACRSYKRPVYWPVFLRQETCYAFQYIMAWQAI